MSQAEALLNSLSETTVDHTHVVPDSDTYFVIDPYTRQIENTNYQKTVLMRGDHNSERFTFEVPRYVDGHDMSLCNRVIVHFDNVGDSIEKIHSDVAYMNDLRINSDKPETVISSWLIRREATQIVGILSFSIQYQCIEDGEVTYEWNTDSYDDIEIRRSKQNGEAAITQYTNVLEQWRSQIFGAGNSVMANISTEGATQVAAVQNESATQQAAIELKGSETLATIPEDYTEVYNLAYEAVRTKTDSVVCEAEGEVITVSDASDDYIRGLNLYGKSTQFTTTGKNLFDMKESVTWTGTYSKDIVIPAGTYKLTYNSATWGGANPPYIRFTANDKWIQVTATTGTAVLEFTKDEDHIYMYSNGSSAANSEGVSATINQLMVSVDAGDYEPYTGCLPSPNPEYPQEIVSVENPTIDIYGSNLLKEWAGYNMTFNGITCTYEGDGVYHIYGTYSGTNPSMQFASMDLNIPVDPTAKYTLSCELVEGTPPDDYHPYVGLSSDVVTHRNWMALKIDNTKRIGEITNNTLVPSDTLENPKYISKFWIYAYNDSLDAYTADFRIRVWLTKSDVPMPYEPYTRQKLTLAHTIPGIPVPEEGNYTDPNGQQWICDEIDMERGVYIHRTVLYTISSDCTITAWNGTDGVVGVNVINLPYDNKVSVIRKGLCTHFGVRVNGSSVSNMVGIRQLCDSYRIYFPNTGDLVDLETWTAFFDEQLANGTPVQLLLPAAEITEPPLTAEEIETYKTLKTNRPNTTILNNSGAMMKVKYNADTQIFLENLPKASDEQVKASVDAWLSAHYADAEGASF